MKKVLCFTYSYHRPKFLRNCIQEMILQTYPVTHAVNIAYDEGDYLKHYETMLSDFKELSNIKWEYFPNKHLQVNAVNALKIFPDFMDYDYYVKIDDDDIYKNRYIENIVNFMNSTGADICSTPIKVRIAIDMFQDSHYFNFGGNPEGTDYNVPFSFAFNKKAMELVLGIQNIYHWEDKMWRDVWYANGLVHKTLDNSDQLIWNIHGRNSAVKV